MKDTDLAKLNCWPWDHKWTMWTEPKNRRIAVRYPRDEKYQDSIEAYQTRICVLCGKVQDRIVQ